jgi:hypothetical protein
MLTRALFAIALICGAAGAAAAEEAKVLALGLADQEVTEEKVAKGLRAPRFNSPGVAYALVEGLKHGDVVEIVLVKDDKPLMHTSETLAEDQERYLLQAGKRGVPAGGWPDGEYHAALKVMRDAKTLIEQTSTPIPFE